jgi:hypothetical protein
MADVLAGLLADISWLPGWSVEPVRQGSWDLRASGPVPAGGSGVLCVEIKRHFTPSLFRNLADRACDAGAARVATRVLGLPRVSSRLGDVCREHGWSWFDLAGNCRLELPGVMLIERSGRPHAPMRGRARASLSSPEAARVVRALLAPGNAGRRWTQRGIVQHFGELSVPVPFPSLALVNKVVRHLRDEAFIEQLPDRVFRVRDHEGLLRAWRDAYRHDRYGRRTWFTLLRGPALDERLHTFNQTPKGRRRAQYAAFSAAEIQAPAVRQPRTWLMVDPFGETALMKAIEAKTVDSGENVVVLVPDDPGVFYEPDLQAGRLPCTNAVQTYIDLSHAGSRGDEAAEAVLQQRLKPAWAQATQ